jgi:cytochrome P450 family 6
MYPLTMIERVCVKDYKIPDSDFVVPKGMIVQIAGTSFMTGNKFFPNPEKFDPDNFGPEKKSSRSPYAFLAFGQGPRNCVGKRFGMLQVKSGLVRLVSNFRMMTCKKTVEQLVPDPLSMSQMPKGGIWIKIQKREVTVES